MKPELLHILQHTVGADQHGRQPKSYRPDGTAEIPTYRNHFITGPGCDNFAHCQDLVDRGWMVDHGVQTLCSTNHCFTVTLAGYSAMRKYSPPPPKLSKAKLRYQHFLEIGDLFGTGPGKVRRYLTYLQRNPERDPARA